MDTTKQAILENLDPTTLAEAACILNQLGLPIEVALNMFLKQVVLYKGLPFDVILPTQDDVKENRLLQMKICTTAFLALLFLTKRPFSVMFRRRWKNSKIDETPLRQIRYTG